MSNFAEAYREVLQCGLVDREVLAKHLDQQTTLDRILPNAFSFFYLIEIATQTYHFMGHRQSLISGYTNAEFMTHGLGLFLQSLHPDEAPIIVNEVYRDFREVVMKTPAADRHKILIQYNYRFRRKDGEFVNLLEQVSVVAFDDHGNGALLLGNVIMLNTDTPQPVQCTIRLCEEGVPQRTVFARNYTRDISPIATLTPREVDILRHLASGKSSKEVGDRLCISPHTVDTHRRTLLKKLDCRSVVELARIAFKQGLL